MGTLAVPMEVLFSVLTSRVISDDPVVGSGVSGCIYSKVYLCSSEQKVMNILDVETAVPSLYNDGGASRISQFSLAVLILKDMVNEVTFTSTSARAHAGPFGMNLMALRCSAHAFLVRNAFWANSQ